MNIQTEPLDRTRFEPRWRLNRRLLTADLLNEKKSMGVSWIQLAKVIGIDQKFFGKLKSPQAQLHGEQLFRVLCWLRNPLKRYALNPGEE